MGGRVKYHKEREAIVFDDSLVHYGFNRGGHDRAVLVIDFARPQSVQVGSSQVAVSSGLGVLFKLHERINSLYQELGKVS